MNRRLASIATACALTLCASSAWGQFSSGSNGSDGAFTATNTPITVRPGGVYNHTTFTVPAGVTLTYLRGADNAPVVILAGGNVQIDGAINLTGGFTSGPSGEIPAQGGLGGPGGFNGGNGGIGTAGGTIQDTPGQGPGGGANGTTGQVPGQPAIYGAPTLFVGLVPLFGGSGGGGGFYNGTNTPAGLSGAGGGGAILIASSTRITVSGSIRANGGNGNSCGSSGNPGCRGGAGSGGAIRLVAPEIAGGGVLQAIGGRFDNNGSSPTSGGPGRIRLEASINSFGGLVDPTPSTATAPGPVSPGGSPALANVPTLAIASVNLIPVPTAPTASYTLPDITLAPGTTGSIPVDVVATNTPVGAPTEITVRLLPRGPTLPTSVLAGNHTGTFASSSATANVNLAAGQVTVLQATAAMTLTGQFASLFPLIDGEPVERVMVAASMGEASTLRLVTKSGKERRVDELPVEDQMRVARAWDAMKVARAE